MTSKKIRNAELNAYRALVASNAARVVEVSGTSYVSMQNSINKKPKKIVFCGNVVQETGYTVKFNQLVEYGDFSALTGWTFSGGTSSIANGECTITANATGVANNRLELYRNIRTSVAGHKYFVAYQFKTNKALSSLSKTVYGGATANLNSAMVVLDNWNIFSQLLTATSTGDLLDIFFNFSAISIGDELRIKNVMCIDLTEMFGAGYELTRDRFTVFYSSAYYPYDEGTFLKSPSVGVLQTETAHTYPSVQFPCQIHSSGEVGISLFISPLTIFPYYANPVTVNAGESISMPLYKVGSAADKIVIDYDRNKAEYVRCVGKIASYNGETVSGEYMSTTGTLSVGAEVLYALSSPEIIDISNSAFGTKLLQVVLPQGNSSVVVLSEPSGTKPLISELKVQYWKKI